MKQNYSSPSIPAQDEIIRWTRLAGRQASEHIATKKSLTN